MSFRLNAKSFLLTYPQCQATKEELLSFLWTKGCLTHYVICKEQHQDGTPHLHAAVMYEDKKNIVNPNYFDFAGYHGNYQTCRNYKASCQYCKKGDDFIEMEEEEMESIEEICTVARKHCREEFLEICLKRKIPYGYFDEAWKLTHQKDTMTISEDSQGNTTI